MKLIIDIPKELYERIKNGYVPLGISTYLKNSTPLDDVKVKIETDLSWSMFDEYGNETGLHKDLMKILDNIGKAESEEE